MCSWAIPNVENVLTNVVLLVIILSVQTKERDNESRLYYQAMKEHRLILGDLRTKEAYIRDQQKKIRELEAELIDFVHAYDVSCPVYWNLRGCYSLHSLSRHSQCSGPL